MKNKCSVNGLKKFGFDLTGIEGQEINRKQFSSDIKLVEGEEKTFIAKISTSVTDADGDVVLPEGCDSSRYEKNPVVQFAHDYSTPPVGKTVQLQRTQDALYAKIKMADTDRANELWSLIKGGFLNANSIGFVVKKACKRGTKEFNEFIKTFKGKVDEECQRIITNYELMENSLVPLPCNSEALIQAVTSKSISISEKTLKEMCANTTKVDMKEMIIEVMKEIAEEGKVVESVTVEVEPVITPAPVATPAPVVEPVAIVEPIKVSEVIPVKEEVKPEPVLQPIAFTVLPEVSLSDDERTAILNELRDVAKRMQSGKIV